MKYKRYERYKDSGVEWIGEIPEEWEVDRLKSSIKSCRNGIWGDEPQGNNNDVACIRVVDFNRTNMEIEGHNLTIRNVSASKRKMYLLKYGDLLIEKSGGGEKQPVGFVTIFNHNIPAVYANFIARMELAEEKAYSGFYKYVHYAMYSVRLNIRSIKQTTGIQNLDTSYYFEERVIYPPLNEQKVIANFLDQKTAEIDDLIADKEKLIELLQEKRQAIITEAVTKGLNPNARMKDSGIEWIGEIPEHWEVVKIKLLLKVKDGTHDTPDFVDENEGTVPLITSKNISNGEIVFLNAKHISREDYKNINRRSNVEKNDVVMPMIGTIGNPVIVKTDKEFSIKNVALFKTSHNELLAKFIYYTLQSHLIKIQFDLLNRGGVQTFVSLDVLRNLLVVKMPSTELKETVQYLDNKTQEIDSLILSIRVGINKLKEYRQSLISEAVTGKIDVREFADKGKVL